MNANHRKPFKQTAIATALAIPLGTGTAHAEPFNFTGTFIFIDASGAEAPPDETVFGVLDPATQTGSFTTQTPFNGFTWIADVDTMFFYDTSGPATQTFTYEWTNRLFVNPFGTCRTGVVIDGCAGFPGTEIVASAVTRGYSFDLTNAGQFGAGVFFDWSVNLDIPVLTTFQITNDPSTSGGVMEVVSFDGRVSAINPDPTQPAYIPSPDGIIGNRMLAGPFPNQTPAFAGTLTPQTCSYTVLPPLDVTDKAVTGTSIATINIGSATVTDNDTGDLLPVSAILAPDTPLVPNTDVDFTTGVSTVIWDKADTTEADCEAAETVTVHEWSPPADITISSSVPATGIDLGTPTDLGGALNPNGVPLLFTNDAPDEYGSGTTVVTWTATDDFGGTTTDTQNVTINLPEGIIGTDCTVDLETVGDRLADGIFTMRDPTGAITGEIDETVTGSIDTALVCTDESCNDVGASLITEQPFFGELWTASPIRLFGEGTWTFETCPGDDSSFCDNPPPPRPLSMTVLNAADNNGVTQLGAHMLFDWSVNKSIDVVVVWDVDCGKSMLTTTDPDGDGILGTKMVDGPFIGFNAAFDLNTLPGEPPIAEGGYEVNVPTYKNPIAGGSPLFLDYSIVTEDELPPDNEANRSCTLGGCIEFEIAGIPPLSSVDVVLPLDGAIPFYSVYRKFINGAWKTYTVDDKNIVKTALRNPENGYCPEPGSPDYSAAESTSVLADMLRSGDQCLQITIEDNGPNDSNADPGTVADPAGVANFPAPDNPEAKTSGDGCSIAKSQVNPMQRSDWWLIGILLAALGWRRNKRQTQH